MHLYVSGQGPKFSDSQWELGRVGDTVTVEDAYRHARLAGLQTLAAAHAALGNLDRVTQVVKVLGFVNAIADFKEHSRVINGCSDLFVEIFAERGRHARSAIGVGSLPRGMTVEVEVIFKVSADTQ